MFNKGIKIKEKPGIPKEKVIYFWVATSNYVCFRSLLNKKHTSNHWMKEVIRGWGVMRRRNIFIQPRRKKKTQEPHEFMTENVWIYKERWKREL